MVKVSEMNDRQWRQAVETQRQVVDELEEREGKQAKLLKSTKTEIKSEKNKLACILRGEDPADSFVDGDTTPEFPFEGKVPDDIDRKDAGDGTRGEHGPDGTPAAKGKGKRGKGPQGVVS